MIVTDRSLHPSVETIRLNRPEVRNAMNAELVGALIGELEAAESDATIRAVVLTGTGNTFSAGADLAALQRLATASFEANLEDSRQLGRLFETLYQMDTPVVGAVNGHAIAGGCGLALLCDAVLAVDAARFGFTEVRVGFVPAIISVYLLERHPESVIRDAFLTGRVFPASEAERRGLIHRVVPQNDFDQALRLIVRELVRESSTDAIAQTKQLLRQRHAGTHASALDRAIELNAQARSTEACRAGVQSFLDKAPFPWQEEWEKGV